MAEPIAVTGLGVVCAIAQTVPEFTQALRDGRCGITRLERPSPSVHVGAPIRDFAWEEWLQTLAGDHPALHRRAQRVLNNNTGSARLSACAATQAFLEAGLDPACLGEVGLIVAGSNLSQDYVARNSESFARTGRFNPRYALSFFDSNQVGSLSDMLSLGGPGCTVGAASASGHAALFNACQWLGHGTVERCLVVGASSNFSSLELEAFAALGAAALGEDTAPEQVCRPFDKSHQGFVWGQASAAVMLETASSARARGAAIHGEIVGASLVMDGNHRPDPSLPGEIRAMRQALAAAGLAPGAIGYLNAHGTASPLGDRTECAAIEDVFGEHLSGLRINSTKSLTGHTMSAAGVLELIATLLQLEHGFLHPNLNLDSPIHPHLRFAGPRCEPHRGDYALSNGFGFGGLNSSLVIKRTTT